MTIINNSLNANSSTPLSVLNGGTGLSNPVAGSILLGNGSSALSSIALSAGQFLVGNDSGVAVAGSIVSPNGTVTVGHSGSSLTIDIGLVSPQHGGTGLSSIGQNALFYGNSSGAFTQFIIGAGQFVYGGNNNSTAPTYGTLTSSDNSIVVTANANSIDLKAVAMTTPIITVTSGAVQVFSSSSTNYIANSSNNANFQLPATAAVGTTYTIIGKTGAWDVAPQNGSSQVIVFGNASTTPTSGYIASTNANDCVTMVCTVANTEFRIISAVGNITLT